MSPHYQCYTIRELTSPCFMVSQWHARRRREASPWMICCPLVPDDGARIGNRSCESMSLRAGGGCAPPPRPTAANTFSMPSNPPSEGPSVDFSLHGARSVRRNPYTSHTRKRVHSLLVEIARPTSSSSHRERGPPTPAQPCPLNIRRPNPS